MSTYRLQLGSHFKFSDLKKVAPYLKTLGITTIYLSPIFKARSTSTHGYDIVDPNRLDPKLGNLKKFSKLNDFLQSHSLKLLIDIVPNHLAISHENSWWIDVLELGPQSSHSSVFAIFWQTDNPHPFIILPFLADDFANLLKNDQIQIRFKDNRFWFQHFEWYFPLCPFSYHALIEFTIRQGDISCYLIKKLNKFLNSVANLSTPKSIRHALKTFLKTTPAISDELDKYFVHQIKSSQHCEFMQCIHEQQFYKLMEWRKGIKLINYRRFFDINELIGVKVERDDVFLATHRFIEQLLKFESIEGVRVDHIDGLRNPHFYLEKLIALKNMQTKKIYVEKILESSETLPLNWPIYGSTGYDFLNYLNELFIFPNGFEIIENDYNNRCKISKPVSQILYNAKEDILINSFSAEWSRLIDKLRTQLFTLFKTSSHDHEDIISVWKDITLNFSHYRSYIHTLPAKENELKYIKELLLKQPKDASHQIIAAYDWWQNRLNDLLYLDNSSQKAHLLLSFFMDWQQLTSALTAKGWEDTFLYRYLPLSSLNEVGGKPWLSKDPDVNFHTFNKRTQEFYPYNMNATSTHDTKRAEDVRFRLSVLSEYAKEWLELLDKWQIMLEPFKKPIKQQLIPDPITEILIYQTLIGSWPYCPEDNLDIYKQRIKNYILKSSRERKEQTSWYEPNLEIENAHNDFIDEIFSHPQFLEQVKSFADKISYGGMWHSLAQIILKVFSPGRPDFYQGSEQWLLRFVDPDNRESVNFSKISQSLKKLLDSQLKTSDLIAKLIEEWQNGNIKHYLTYQTLQLRNQYEKLLTMGSYDPFPINGPLAKHIVGFKRVWQNQHLIVLTGRWIGKLLANHNLSHYDSQIWQDQYVELPAISHSWRELLSGRQIANCQSNLAEKLPLNKLFFTYPLALIISDNA